jgi:3,4-dihydroxy 2-butanone 4-phosphate synthase/GTP cyclohydrolase II
MNFGKVPSARLPTRYGEFVIYGFKDPETGEEAVALVAGNPKLGPALVRIHSQCLTGDVFASARCDCGEQLHAAMLLVAESQCGVIVYQQQEGRGIGLVNKIHAYELQDQGLDTVSANEKLGFKPDLREYRLPAAILRHLGVRQARLLSNNPEKVEGLQGEGIEVGERIPLEIPPRESTRDYLRAKKDKLGHILHKL